MTRGLLLVRDGFVESHLEYAYHRLREDAVLVDVASPDGGTVRGDRGSQWDSVTVDELPDGRRYDLVVVPGGTGSDLPDDDATGRWLAEHVAGGGVVCTVADAVRLLVAIDAVAGRMVTGPDDAKADLEAAGAIHTGEAVTVDGPLVTVRDTEALPFGIAATLGNVAIPQGSAAEARERPFW